MIPYHNPRQDPDRLQIRSGRLRGSIKGVITGNTLDSLEGRTFSNVEYAEIHEFGGVIPPPNNIPLDKNLTESGQQRFSVEEVIAQGGHWFTSRKGNRLLKLGDDLMFFGKMTETEIPPRLKIRHFSELEAADYVVRVQDLVNQL
jgi:hypothetical protein